MAWRLKAFVCASLGVAIAAHAAVWPRIARATTQSPTITTFPINGGVGSPWGTAVDAAGAVWFAEAGCDFAPTCPADVPPGQIGRFDPSAGTFTHYTLPDIPGNQPIFVRFDGSGNLWFTTPNNSMIGEFSPATRSFVGQWPVTPGSGPWDLTFANGQLWFTEHYGAAVGRFDPATHAHQDFPTPSADSNPYGITAGGGLVWFTENNSSVDRVAVLDTAADNAISEYEIVQPRDGTPHLIAVGPDGHPWWTEGWSDTIATLDPAVAVPGSCGAASGVCKGVQRFPLPPPSSTCGFGAHASGIAVDGAANRVWLDDSLTDEVGWFTPSTGAFDLSPVGSCNSHPHDGLSLDAAGNAWVSEQFANAIAVIRGPSAGSAVGPPTGATSAPPGTAPANVVQPTIHGRLREGQTLVARTGSWVNEPASFSYRWQRCRPACADVAVGAGDSYRLSARDIDRSIRVVVTAGNAAGSGRSESRTAGPIGPSVRRVKAALAKLLATSAKRSAITRLLGDGSRRAAFGAPSRGRLSIAFRVRGSTFIGGARRHFAKAGDRMVTIRLTRSGRRLLKRAAKLRLAVQVLYVPVGEPAVRSSRRLTWLGGEAG